MKIKVVLLSLLLLSLLLLFLAVSYHYFHNGRYTDKFIEARSISSNIKSGREYPAKAIVDAANVYMAEAERLKGSWFDPYDTLFADAIDLLKRSVKKGSVDGAVQLRKYRLDWDEFEGAADVFLALQRAQNIQAEVAAALGEIYYRGTKTVPKSDSKSAHYLLIAAGTGDPDAYPMLAELSAKYGCNADSYAWDLLSQPGGSHRIFERHTVNPSPQEMAVGDAKVQLFHNLQAKGKKPEFQFEPACALNKNL